MYAFDYHKPSSLQEASALLAANDEATVVAGGMTLIPTLKHRLAQPSDLIDLSGVAELKGIAMDGDTLVIGAMTTHATVANDATVRAAVPALADLAAMIGDAQVRNCGTIGGSVSNNDPAADYPAGLLALGATIVTTKRSLSADDFFTGMFDTALDQGEIVTEIRVPKPGRAAYAKFPNPASRYAIVGVMVAQGGGGTRVAVTGAGQDGVFRATDIEQALAGSFTADAAKSVAVSPDNLSADIHASAEYRAHLVSVMASRAVAACS